MQESYWITADRESEYFVLTMTDIDRVIESWLNMIDGRDRQESRVEIREWTTWPASCWLVVHWCPPLPPPATNQSTDSNQTMGLHGMKEDI